MTGTRATPQQIRETVAGDRAELARSLADAFMDDPVACWAAPPERLRWSCLRRFFGAYLSIRVPLGLVWNDRDLAGVAIWSPPGKGVTSPVEALRLIAAYRSCTQCGVNRASSGSPGASHFRRPAGLAE